MPRADNIVMLMRDQLQSIQQKIELNKEVQEDGSVMVRLTSGEVTKIHKLMRRLNDVELEPQPKATKKPAAINKELAASLDILLSDPNTKPVGEK